MNIGYNTCMTGNCTERKALLNEIGKIDFVLTELTLYLDTHPHDQQMIEKFHQYNMIKSKLTKEYAEKFGPLVRSCMDINCQEWQWSLQDNPWEGGYY